MSRFWFLAVAVLFVVSVYTGCLTTKEEKEYKLAYEVTKGIQCIPWQLDDNSDEVCLCFGEARAFSVFAFLGPDHLCFEVDENGDAVYEPETDEQGLIEFGENLPDHT